MRLGDLAHLATLAHEKFLLQKSKCLIMLRLFILSSVFTFTEFYQTLYKNQTEDSDLFSKFHLKITKSFKTCIHINRYQKVVRRKSCLGC